MPPNTAIRAGVRLLAVAKPTGTRNSPIAAQKAGNVWTAGRTANSMIAAATMPMVAVSANAIAPRYARSPFGDINKTTMATITIAKPPFGQAVATQRSSTAPTVTNARAPLITAGSQSGVVDGTSRYSADVRLGASTSSANPSRT